MRTVDKINTLNEAIKIHKDKIKRILVPIQFVEDFKSSGLDLFVDNFDTYKGIPLQTIQNMPKDVFLIEYH